MIYKWEDFKLEINESNSWKLFQFDFTGLSNTTETISTVAGNLNEEPRDLPRVAPRAALETLFTHTDQVRAVEALPSSFPECGWSQSANRPFAMGGVLLCFHEARHKICFCFTC